MLVYKLPTNLVLKLSQVYSSLEQIRENLCYSTSSFIEDYSLSQTTLDDVFIHFARQQSEKEGTLDASGAKGVTEGRKGEGWRRKGGRGEGKRKIVESTQVQVNLEEDEEQEITCSIDEEQIILPNTVSEPKQKLKGCPFLMQ